MSDSEGPKNNGSEADSTGQARIYQDGGDTIYEVDQEAGTEIAGSVRRAAEETAPQATDTEQQREISRKAKAKTAAKKVLRGGRRGGWAVADRLLAVIEIIENALRSGKKNKDSVLGILQQIFLALAVYLMQDQETAFYWAVGCLVVYVLLYLAKIKFGEGPIIANLRAWLQRPRKISVKNMRQYIKDAWLTHHIEKPGNDSGERENG